MRKLIILILILTFLLIPAGCRNNLSNTNPDGTNGEGTPEANGGNSVFSVFTPSAAEGTTVTAQ